MKALQLLVLACASLAVSAKNKYEIFLDFDAGCVRECGGNRFWTRPFTDLGSAHRCIDTVQRIAGKCEWSKLYVRYTMDEGLASCGGKGQGGSVIGVSTGDLVRELSYLDYDAIFLGRVDLIYDQENPFMGSKDCSGATIRGTGDVKDACTSLTQEPYPTSSEPYEVDLEFKSTSLFLPVNFTHLALQADLGQGCMPRGRMTGVAVKLIVNKAIKTPVAIKDATIVFPHQPDCAPSGCEAISGARDVKVCLVNARAEPSCKRAVYTRTYSNLTSFRCERTSPTRILLNMDSVLADDRALDFEDKQTLVTGVKFAYTSLNKECAAPVLTLGEHCYTLGLPSILVEFPPSSFNFIPDWRAAAGIDEYNKTRPSSKEKRLSYNPNGDEVNLKTQFQPTANYTLTVRCPVIENPDGNEATLKTHFTISRSGSSVSSTDGEESTAGVVATINTLTSRSGKRLIKNFDGKEVTMKTQSTMLHPESSSSSTSDGKSTNGVVATINTLTSRSGKRLIKNFDGDQVTLKTQSTMLHPSRGDGKSTAAIVATKYTQSARTGMPLIDNSDGDEATIETQSTTLQPRSSSTSTGDGKSTAGVVATDYTLTTKNDKIDNPAADDVTTKAHPASLRSKPSGSHGRIPIAGILTTAATILCICSQ